MKPHTHNKEEVYIFSKGNGCAVADETFYPVGSGEVACIPPDALHSVVNESEGEPERAAFWWDIAEPRDRNGGHVREEHTDECSVFNDRQWFLTSYDLSLYRGNPCQSGRSGLKRPAGKKSIDKPAADGI